MNTRKVIVLAVVTQAITLIVTVALMGFVPGVRAQQAAATGVHHFSLLAETMQPVDSTIGYDNYYAYLTTTQNSTVWGTGSYIGQLDLPDGAQITAVRCYGQDTDPSHEFQFQVWRYRLWDEPNVFSEVTEYKTSGVAWAGGKVMLTAAVVAGRETVDNAEYSYGLYVLMPAPSAGTQLGLLRCVVDANYAAYLPAVQKNATQP